MLSLFITSIAFFNLSELIGFPNQLCCPKENKNIFLTYLLIVKQYLTTYMIIIFRFHLRY